MIHIFIEADKQETPEAVFLKTFLEKVLEFVSGSYEILCARGWNNLYNETNVNKMVEYRLAGEQFLIIADADMSADVSNYGGLIARRKFLKEQLAKKGVTDVPMYFWPDNSGDGIFESMLQNLMLYDKHERFFHCFNDYENCLGDSYVHPNLKGKVFTYISSMKMSNRKRKSLGMGLWMFDDPEYWNLNHEILSPLKTFLLMYK